jgi:hypothetical protein
MMDLNKAIGCMLGGAWGLAGIGCLTSGEFRATGACAAMVGATYCWYRLVVWSDDWCARRRAG